MSCVHQVIPVVPKHCSYRSRPHTTTLQALSLLGNNCGFLFSIQKLWIFLYADKLWTVRPSFNILVPHPQLNLKWPYIWIQVKYIMMNPWYTAHSCSFHPVWDKIPAIKIVMNMESQCALSNTPSLELQRFERLGTCSMVLTFKSLIAIINHIIFQFMSSDSPHWTTEWNRIDNVSI